MKLQFDPSLAYQQEAVAAVCDVFEGQTAKPRFSRWLIIWKSNSPQDRTSTVRSRAWGIFCVSTRKIC